MGVGHADAKLSVEFRAMKSKSPTIVDEIMNRLRACQKKARVGGANRGNRSGPAPTPPRKTTVARGIPNLHEMKLLDTKFMHGSTEIFFIDITEFSLSSTSRHLSNK